MQIYYTNCIIILISRLEEYNTSIYWGQITLLVKSERRASIGSQARGREGKRGSAASHSLVHIDYTVRMKLPRLCLHTMIIDLQVQGTEKVLEASRNIIWLISSIYPFPNLAEAWSSKYEKSYRVQKHLQN